MKRIKNNNRNIVICILIARNITSSQNLPVSLPTDSSAISAKQLCLTEVSAFATRASAHRGERKASLSVYYEPTVSSNVISSPMRLPYESHYRDKYSEDVRDIAVVTG